MAKKKTENSQDKPEELSIEVNPKEAKGIAKGPTAILGLIAVVIILGTLWINRHSQPTVISNGPNSPPTGRDHIGDNNFNFRETPDPTASASYANAKPAGASTGDNDRSK